VYGRSLGGAVAINLASQQVYQNVIKGLILENTFTSISDMIDSVLPVLKYFKFLSRNRW
jgi:alpha-beta hydrolase superfamily lysophospholipase